ncbi:MAG: hypothetical protein DCC75_02795 [Proteobacteria bacterium]|nr:MAG: hypothetical protein DCC75_02795 [Pseudomonadota bacterium]
MVFGTPNKGKPMRRPGMDPRADALARRRNSNDATIEGNLKQLLDNQEMGGPGGNTVVLEAEMKEIDAPLIRLVNCLLAEAVKSNASDIHLEPFETMLRVRFRVDGVLHEVQKIPHKLAPAISSRLKIMADLDICEKRIPQDGSFNLKFNGVEADFRISSLPSVFGEKIVMRVMGTTQVNNDLSKLGIPVSQLKTIREAIHKPDGLVLVTGPTGSGKTTTLYAALNELNDISVSVFTAEDPVEGNLQGVTQCQVNPQVGYTFAAILRSLLRQDPDVILVGEIRDQETAEISIKAALTGHVVLSTLHTNCSVSTISRLLNMGIAPYLITSSVNCIVAQRLVRRICEGCKEQISAPPEVLNKLGKGGEVLKGSPLWHGKGCDQCRNSGYKGRAPIYEVLVLSDELRQMILAGASKEDLRRVARMQGLTTLREAGLQLVKDGVSTLEEVLGATNEDSEGAGVAAAPISYQAAAAPAAVNVAGDQSDQVSMPVSPTEIAQIPAPQNGTTGLTQILESADSMSNASQMAGNCGQNLTVVVPAAGTEPDDKARQAALKWKTMKMARQGATGS